METQRQQAGTGRHWARGFRALTLASVFTLPAAAQTAPQGGTVVVGGASISQQAGQTLINQSTDRALIDWRSFDIGAGQAVTVAQPGAGSLLVNRVTGGGTGTRIDGSLTANGQVIVIDKAGIVIGRGARIDAGAFLATTADLDNADFAAGRLVFGTAGAPGAAIINEGTIRVSDAGYAALAAAIVENRGLVEAKLGRVVLAGAERFTLDLAGDGLLRFELPAEVAGRVVNAGTLSGASVLLTARAARDGMAGVVNAGGLIEATSARAVDGRIVIGGEGTDTLVTGAVTAQGGDVDILGDRVALVGAQVDVSAADGGGTVRIGGDYQGGGDLVRSQSTRIDAASLIQADATGTGAGGRIIVWSDGRTDYAGSISARGAGGGEGGFAEVSGKGSLRFAGKADLSAAAGAQGGTLLLDPTSITIGTTADVDGDSTQGDDVTGNIGQTDYSGAASLITASAIADLLNAGTSVSLSASQDITLSSSIAKTSGFGASLTLTAGRDIIIGAGAGVTSSSGALNITLTAGSGSNAGQVVSAATGTESFTSNGGNISFTGYGRSGAISGVDLSGASLSSGSGSISLTGTGYAGDGSSGVHIADGSILQSGSGSITLTGTSGGGNVGRHAGLDFDGTGHNQILTSWGSVSLTGATGGSSTSDYAIGIRAVNLSITASSNGSISLTGTSSTGGGSSYGIELNGATGTRSISSNGGSVTLTGTGGGSSGSLNYGVMLYSDHAVSAGSGSVTVNATGGSGSIAIANERDSNASIGGASQSGTVTINADGMALGALTVRSSGTVVLAPKTSGKPIDIGSTTDSVGGNLALSQTELNRVTAGTLIIGSSLAGTISASSAFSPTNVGTLQLSNAALTVNAGLAALAQAHLNAGKNVTLTSQGDMTLSSSIAKSAGADATLTLRAGSDLSFNSGIGVTASTGKLSMDFTAGYVTTGTLTTTGSGSFTSNGGDIALKGLSGVSLSGSSVTAGAGTIILAGADLALSGTSITSTGRVQLRPYAAGGQMDIGATGAGSGKAHVSQAELNQISAGVLRLGSLDGGNMVISNALSHASDQVELASAGTVTQSANISVDKLALLGSGATYTLTRSGNAVTTLAADTGSIDFHSGSSLAVGTVAGTAGIRFSGDASLYAHDTLITLGAAASYAGSGTGTLTLSSDIDVAVTANVGVSGSGKLNIVLAADGNESGSAGQVAISGASLSSNGGDITIGSGSTPATRAAVGKTATGIGVNITGSTLNAGTGGDILVNGEGADSGTNSATGIGINVSASTLQAAGNGTITLNGTGGAGNTLTAGIAIGGDSSIRTASGAIALNGEQATTGTGRYGVLFRADTTGSTIYSSGAAAITITATGTAGKIAANSSITDYSKALIGCSATNSCYGGTITLKADRLDLTDAGAGSDSAPSMRVGGTGSLVIRPNSTTSTIAVGDGATGSELRLTQADIDALNDGLGSVTIGHTDDTGDVSVAGAAFKSNVTIQGGTGDVAVSGALTTGSGTAAGTIGLISKGLLTISAALSTQNQDITLTTDKLALTGSLDAGTAIATVTIATAARGIDLGSTGASTSSLDISDAELKKLTAGTLRIGSSSAGAISISAAIAPTGTDTLHLRSGAGISQTGAITVANLAVTAAGTVALAGANNAVTSFAATATNSNVSFRDDTGFAIGSVDGVAGVSIGTGALTLTSTGTVTQSAAITAAGLALLGTGGTYTLAHASNAVSTVAASTGSIDVGLSGAATVGAVGATRGIAATGTVKLSTGGNLSLASGAAVSASGAGDALVLAASGTFTNNGGASALTVGGGGRFLVFSTSPLTSSTGGISALPLYNRSFAFDTRTYTTVSNSGSRFVYSYAPTLTVTPDTVTRTYSGATQTGLAYTITGLVTGDTLANAVSGTGAITGAGRNVGTYTLTAGAGTLASDLGYGFSYGTGTLTIDAKALTYAVANSNSTYGTLATNGAVTLTGVVDGDSVAGTVSTYRGADSVTLAARTGVGSLTQKVTALTGTDAGNYTIAATGNSNGTLTIATKALTYAVAAANSTYGTLATLGAVTLTGVVEGDIVTASAQLSGATLAERLAAGTYTQVAGSLGGADAANYSLAGGGNSTSLLTIARKSVTYALTNANSTYGTLAVLPTATLTGVLSNDVVTGTVVVDGQTLTDRLAAGSYTTKVSALAGAASANYVIADSGNQNAGLTVARKTITGSVNNVSSIYGQSVSAGAAVLSGVLSGDQVTGTVVVEKAGSAVTPGPTLDAGSYDQRITGITGTASANYELGSTSQGTLTIDKAALTIVAANQTRIYGTADPTLTYTTTGLVNGDQVSGALSRAAGKDVGTYAISQGDLSASQNYTISFTGATLTINPAALTITALSQTKIYGDADPTLSYQSVGLVAGDSLSGALSRAGGENAGTYAISQGSLTAGANYTISLVGADLTITPAPLTVTANAITKTYGQQTPALTYQVAGLKRGDGAGSVLSGALSDGGVRDAGTYAIAQGSLAANANYTLTYQGASLTISPAVLTVTATSLTKTYGQDDPELTYQAVGLVAGDSLSGALVRAAGQDAGTYAIGQGSLNAGPNYTMSFTGGTLTINPAALTVTALSQTKTYGDSDAPLAYQAVGLVAGDSLSGALVRAGGENVGSYAIGQGSLTAGSNYVLSFTGGALTIKPAALSVTAASASVTYGDALPVLGYSVSGLKRGDSAATVLSGSLSAATGSNVGTYAIGQGSLSANANYTLSFTGGTLTINPALLSVTASSASVTYGDAVPVLGYSVSGLKRGDSEASVLSGSLSAAAGSDVGAYAITQGSLSANANYTLSFTGGTLTINPALLSVTAESQRRTYGDADGVLTYSVSGLKGADSATSVLSGALARAAGNDAGTYAINQGSLSANANYRIRFTGGQLTIDPAILSVIANAVSRPYGASDPALTYSVSGLKGADSAASVLSGGLTRAAGGNAGRYAIQQGTLTAVSNYKITYTGADLTITPVALTVAVDSATRMVGAANPIFTAQFTGLVNGDAADSLTDLRITSPADANSAAGSYAIIADGISNPNYVATYVNGVLSVTGGGVLPPVVAEAAPITTVTQPARAPTVPTVTTTSVAAAPAAPVTAPIAPVGSAPAPALDAGSAALAAASQSVQSASGSKADDDSAAEEMIPGLLSQQRRLPGQTPEGTPGLEQQFPNLGRVW